MKFHQIKYVAEIARCGSINKAAAKLFVSQSSISSALKELEAEIKIPIFKRSNQGVELTAEGRQFLSYANSLLERKEYIESLYASTHVEPEAQFSISTQRYPFAVDAFVNLSTGHGIRDSTLRSGRRVWTRLSMMSIPQYLTLALFSPPI